MVNVGKYTIQSIHGWYGNEVFTYRFFFKHPEVSWTLLCPLQLGCPLRKLMVKKTGWWCTIRKHVGKPFLALWDWTFYFFKDSFININFERHRNTHVLLLTVENFFDSHFLAVFLPLILSLQNHIEWKYYMIMITYLYLTLPVMIKGVPFPSLKYQVGGVGLPDLRQAHHGNEWKRPVRWRDLKEPYEARWRKSQKSEIIFKSYHFLIFPPRKIAVRWWNSNPSFLHVLSVLRRQGPISPSLAKKCRKNVSEIPEISSPLKIGRNPQGKDRLPTIIFQGFWLLVWRNYDV